MFKALRYMSALLFLMNPSLFCTDVLLEFKVAGFFPTNSCVKKIYGKGAVLYGPEVTAQLCNTQWYGFASVDFLSKEGHSIGLCERTKMSVALLALGAKYFVPFCYGDFYVGLGFSPLHLKTRNCSPFVAPTTSKWGFGGIAKVGAYFDLPCNYFLDLFIDYNFAKVSCQNCFASVIPLKAKLNGVIVGLGLGYRFN